MKNFRDVLVWNKAHDVALSVYALTQSFPRDERFGLVTQMRRSAVSIPANIAEGCGRSDPEFIRFLEISKGSANELDYQLHLSRELGFMTEVKYLEISGKILEVQKMVGSLVRKIRSTHSERGRLSALANS
jgi:four helix bundle protein